MALNIHKRFFEAIGTPFDAGIPNGTYVLRPQTDDTGALNIGNGTTDMDFKVFLGSTTEFVNFDVGDSTVYYGGDDKGVDCFWYGETASRAMSWDQSADALQFLDNTKVQFGTGDDAQIYFDATDLQIDATAGGVHLDSTTALKILIGSVDLLAFDDSALTLVAADDVAGQDCYIQTEDGGADAAVDNGQVGGLLELRTGDGSAGGAAKVGGAGGALSCVAGAGGVPASGSANGGAGGQANVTAGAGGAAGAGGGTGGAGGNIILTPGAAGGAGGGSAGAKGVVGTAAGLPLCIGNTTQPATVGTGNYIVMETNGTAPSSTVTTSGVLYVKTAGDDMTFLHADGTTDELGT